MKLIAALALLAASTLHAEAPKHFPSLKLTDGTEYRDAFVKSVTPAELHLTHLKGYSRIPLSKLPPELQKEFGYDGAKAALWREQTGNTPTQQAARQESINAYLAQKKGADAARAKLKAWQNASAILMTGEVTDVSRAGVWLKDAKAATETGKGQVIFVTGELGTLHKGNRFSAKMWPVGAVKRDEVGSKPVEALQFTTTPPDNMPLQ